jgi:hypothetical protein
MRLIRLVAISASFVAVVCGAAISWQVYKTKVNERRLTEEVNVCRAGAEQGDAKSEYDLGSKYYYGLGVQQGYAEAVRWYEKAADQGYPRAELALGLVYHLGHGVEQNDAEAVRWYTKGADHRNLDAENYLAYMYHGGSGVSRDYARALLWYLRAAGQGSAYAETEIGRMYDLGQGVPQDSTQAVGWYRKAADQGYAKGEYDLGVMLFHGKGVPLNRFEARRWFRRAAVQGDQYAIRAISERLSPSREINLFIELVGGLFLSTSFLSLNKFEPVTDDLRDSKRTLSAATGLLCLLSAGLGWYGYTHDRMWPLIYGPNAFTVFARSLDGALFILLYFVLVDKKRRTGTAEMAAENSTETESDTTL